MEDARKTSMQDKMGGITEVMKQADLFRQGDVGQFYAADGGRIGYRHGKNYKSNQGSNEMKFNMDAKIKYLKEMGASDEEIFDIIVKGKDISDQYKTLGGLEGERRAEPFYPDRFEGERRAEPFYPDRFEGRLEPMAQGGRIRYADGRAGYPPVTMGQVPQAPPQMPAPQGPQAPMPAPQPNQMPMMGGMNPMARGMNPMARRMNPMMGGRRMAQEGGLMDLGGMEKDYRDDGGFVPLGEEEKADDVPARLSKNEFVFTADAVRAAGGGDIDKGAGIMERVMENLEQGGQISEESQGLSGAREMFDVSERLSEVV
jgi:hypothetical protein